MAVTEWPVFDAQKPNVDPLWPTPLDMGLDELSADVESEYADLADEFELTLDRETKHELAMLTATLDADPAELLRRGIHLLFQHSVERATLDFHLRSAYDVTYDEYLSGMTYDEMTGADFPQPDDDRRYNF